MRGKRKEGKEDGEGEGDEEGEEEEEEEKETGRRGKGKEAGKRHFCLRRGTTFRRSREMDNDFHCSTVALFCG